MNGRKEIPMKINEELEQLLKNLKLRRILDIYDEQDRKSTRLNSSHSQISYAVFCLKKKKNKTSRSKQAYLLRGSTRNARLLLVAAVTRWEWQLRAMRPGIRLYRLSGST